MPVNNHYQQGQIAFAADPAIDNPYREGTKRALWWRRGWLDAEAVLKEDWIDPDEYHGRILGVCS